jgi:pimeloyl-ACP methyl ester carboxylesterase
MDYGGSVPEPLLPPHIALQNPHLIGGYSFYVFPDLNKILVMIDNDGDENYQPMVIPINGGFPEPAFGDHFDNFRVHLGKCDNQNNLVYLTAESRSEQMNITYQGNLTTGVLQELGRSAWGCIPDGVDDNHSRAILIDGYTVGDNVLYLWEQAIGERRLLYGTPLEERLEDQEYPLNAIVSSSFTQGNGLLFVTALFSDQYGLGYFPLSNPDQIGPVQVAGIVHTGFGEMVYLEHLDGNHYLVGYNIDGCSWLYEGKFDETQRVMELKHVICGQGVLANGVLEHVQYDKISDRFAISFSTATSPTQIYTIEGDLRDEVIRHTNERVLGIPQDWLSEGEEYSYTSFDGMRISSRLYLPSNKLGFKGRRPVVYYVHGGPQGQERPDFAWFSMPLIQFLTLNGFAVFVPNVRGSTGYGLNYAKEVDRDWGGEDRLDHVFAMEHVLPNDSRIDAKRVGVVGRSYGGYMSLTLAARHPDLWAAAVDMFGPYDLLTFMDRIPETWKPYFAIAVGDPNADREFLIERSPRVYMDNLASPLLVIQGRNDPRVVERESRDVVENLRAKGKTVEFLVFENEGHDILKYDNRVTCYNAITDFFKQYLRP